jgi:hypothetical protein
VLGQSNILQMDSSSNKLQGVLTIDHPETEHIKLVIECLGECVIEEVHLTMKL